MKKPRPCAVGHIPLSKLRQDERLFRRAAGAPRLRFNRFFPPRNTALDLLRSAPAVCSSAKLRPAWACMMAKPSASAASGPGSAGKLNKRLTISCTWALAALPWPATAFFICKAVYSATGKLALTKAVRQAPRA